MKKIFLLKKEEKNIYSTNETLEWEIIGGIIKSLDEYYEVDYNEDTSINFVKKIKKN